MSFQLIRDLERDSSLKGKVRSQIVEDMCRGYKSWELERDYLQSQSSRANVIIL